MNNTQSTRWNQFESLRIYAALIIVGSHCHALGLTGQGGLMVAFFFVLSGFFITKPMITDGENTFLFISGWLRFYGNRIIRIIPAYWLVVLCVYLLTNHEIMATKEILLQNMFFLNCQGHLWYLQQEVLCYVIAPVLILVIALTKKYFHVSNLSLGISLLLCGIFFQFYFTKISSLLLHGNGTTLHFQFGLFAIGMATGYICKSNIFLSIHCDFAIIITDIITCLIILLGIFSSGFFLSLFKPELLTYNVGWQQPVLCSIIIGALFLLLHFNPHGRVVTILQYSVLTKLGNVSYGVYLIHFFLIPYIKTGSTTLNFLITICISVLLANLSYYCVEQPIIKLYKHFF